MTSKRILAVENNDLVLSFLEAGLTSVGYDVDTAHNGREALEKLDHVAYDLIITDVRMPELDGPGLCRALIARRSRYRLSCARRLDPPRIPAGQPTMVTARVENVSRLRTGVLLAEDVTPRSSA